MSTKYTIRLPWPGPRRQRAGTDFEPTPVTTLTRTSDRSYTHAVIWQYAARGIWDASWCGRLDLAEAALRCAMKNAEYYVPGSLQIVAVES